MSAATTKELADAANRARCNHQLRAVGIVDMLIARRVDLGLTVAAIDKLNTVTNQQKELLHTLGKSLDDAARAKADAEAATEAWLASILPTVDEAVNTDA